MTGQPTRLVHLATVAALAATFALGGCSDGLEVNGKLFDWLGVSSTAMEQAKREPQVAARTPLVLPPNSSKLPEPGSGQEASADLASLGDPDAKKAAAAGSANACTWLLPPARRSGRTRFTSPEMSRRTAVRMAPARVWSAT
jgi:hypothetical protein